MTIQDWIISDQAQTIERLERELAEEHAVNVQAQRLLDAEIARATSLEAQCAAMRGALNQVVAVLEDRQLTDVFVFYAVHGMKYYGPVADLAAAKTALSSDAGAKMLKVVEAAQRVSAALLHEHGAPTGVTKDLAEALAALEDK